MAFCKLLLFSILFVIPCIYSLNFDLSSLGTERNTGNIILYGSAFIQPSGLQVTTNDPAEAKENKTGQARYVEPLHLWDEASGQLANFETKFTFVIKGNRSCFADGLAFFLAPSGTGLLDESYGYNLGLYGRRDSYPFLAVEFDTFNNTAERMDPSGPHVGIDINSTFSVVTALWGLDISGGHKTDVWITYDSTSETLKVVFTGASQIGELNYSVNPSKFLPEWVDVGFSASTGDCFESHTVSSWSFSSTTLESPQNNTSSLHNNPPQNSSKTMKTGERIGLVAGLLLVIIVLALVGYKIRKKTTMKRSDAFAIEKSMDEEIGKGSGPNKFSYEELVQATDNFSEDKKLGEGGFGKVYKGFLTKLHVDIAVKRRISKSNQGSKEYITEVKTISQLRHRNLVQLMGWCHEKSELLLVYEFMPNSSLDLHLYKGISLLTWDLRCKIVRGVASALLYLHEGWEKCVLHRDLKSSNIMLDSGFNAKVGDFGMARFIDHEKEAYSTHLAGTMGYMAPEYFRTWKASKETDVYSFGIVLLEIACGRRPIFKGINLVEWVWNLYATGDILEAADPKLCLGFDNQQMECLLIVGLWCAHPVSKSRPSIKLASNVLSLESHLPTLPLKMPMAFENVPLSVPEQTYSSTASLSTSSNFTNSSNFQSDPAP